MIRLALVATVVALVVVTGHGQLLYEQHGQQKSVGAVQLWYNGFWKHPGWINGTMVPSTAAPPLKSGRIVCVKNVAAPYDRYIVEEIKCGAVAVVFLRDRTGSPGQTMYLVTGSDQSDLIIPVVEVFEDVANSDLPLAKNLPQEGIPVSIWPQVNQWKVANDKTGFQVAWNVIHSFMALGVILIGAYRLIEWWTPGDRVWFAIGPVCLLLLMIGAVLRMAYTMVDPLWSFRIWPDTASSFFLTFNLPFTFASGILLTFFWAETLKVNKVQASPFISEHRWLAFGLCGLLFVAEIVADATRTVVPVSAGFNPTYISQAVYVITCILLTISYIICAHKIQQKIGALSGRKRKLRNMTLRFTGSTGGYIGFAILTILLIPFLASPWPFKIILNLLLFTINTSSLLQAYSFQRPGRRTFTSSADLGSSALYTPGGGGGGGGGHRTDFTRGYSAREPVRIGALPFSARDKSSSSRDLDSDSDASDSPSSSTISSKKSKEMDQPGNKSGAFKIGSDSVLHMHAGLGDSHTLATTSSEAGIQTASSSDRTSSTVPTTAREEASDPTTPLPPE